MSNEHTTPPEHEEIARLLAEQGPVDAPPDLAANVMRQVHAEPRPARRLTLLPSPRRLRPALAYCAAAVVLVAIGFGVAHLGANTTSSSGGAAAEDMKAAAGGTRGALVPGVAPQLGAVTIQGVPVSDALRVLPASDRAPFEAIATADSTHSNAVAIDVPAAKFDALSRKLHAAAARSTGGNRITIVLRRR